MNDFEKLKDPELQARLKEAKNPADILAIAKEQGYELSEDELEAISGGSGWGCDDYEKCPRKYAYLSR